MADIDYDVHSNSRDNLDDFDKHMRLPSDKLKSGETTMSFEYHFLPPGHDFVGKGGPTVNVKETSEKRFARKYIACLNASHKIVLCLWFLFAAVGAIGAALFMGNTTTSFEPPPSSQAAKDKLEVEEYFPGLLSTSDMVLWVYANDVNTSVLRPEIEEFVLQLNKTLKTNKPEVVYDSYYTFKSDGFPIAAGQALLSPGPEPHRAMIIHIGIDIDATTKDAQDYAKYIIKTVEELKPKDNRETFTLTGVSAFIGPIVSAAEEDLGKVDAIVLPLAMIVLAFILKSARLMLIPICCVGVSASTSFCIMYLITLVYEVNAITPTLMMSILIAMNIDYSLFLLSRYREALGEGQNPFEAVVDVFGTAGHTILVSGMTLLISFMGLLFFPLNMLVSLGIGCTVAMFCTLAINLSLTPCLLLMFPIFFSNCMRPCCGDKSDVEDPNYRTVCLRFGLQILHKRVSVVLVLLICVFVIPFGFYSFGGKTSDSNDLNLPRDIPQTDAFQQMSTLFGPSLLYPFSMLIVAPPDVNALSLQYFQESHQIVHEIAISKGCDYLFDVHGNNTIDSFTGLVYASGQPIPWVLLYECENGNVTNQTLIEACVALAYAKDMYVNDARTAQWVMIQPHFDPLGKTADAWLTAMRAAMADVEIRHPGYRLYMWGLTVDSLDSIEKVYQVFPFMIAITGSVVLLITGVAFKSILIPIRAVVSIGLTVVWVYGLADLTYEYGIFDWTGVYGLSKMGALDWMIPIMNFSIIVGVGLDYDIFLMVRVREAWLEGHSAREAVLVGLDKTGHIIIAAGLIMAIAFSGLLFSSLPAVNQLSFYLVFAVLFDTFIVASILVPCLLNLLGDSSYWPMKRMSHVDKERNSQIISTGAHFSQLPKMAD